MAEGNVIGINICKRLNALGMTDKEKIIDLIKRSEVKD